MAEDFNALFKKLIGEWKDKFFQAEEVIKEYEKIGAKVVYVSIQELRYSGRRVAQAYELFAREAPLSDDEQEQVRIHLIEAIQNCVKARHDAIDASYHFVHKRLDSLVDSVGLPKVIKYFPEYIALREEIIDVAKKIVESRKNRKAIDEIYADLVRTSASKLVQFNLKLESSEEILRSLIANDRKKRIKQFIIANLIALIVGASGSMVANRVELLIK